MDIVTDVHVDSGYVRVHVDSGYVYVHADTKNAYMWILVDVHKLKM